MFLSLTVWRGEDPSTNVVLLEDFAAVLGVAIAGSCMSLSYFWNTSVPDAIGSLLIGGLLGVTASFIIYTNASSLVGRSVFILFVINYGVIAKVNVKGIFVFFVKFLSLIISWVILM